MPETKLKPDSLSMKIMGYGIIFAIWLIAGNLLEKTFSKNNLRHLRGRVKEIKRSSFTSGGRTVSYYEKVKIAIDGYSGYYTASGHYGKGNGYAYGIETGDTIDIYVRKWFQYLCTMGRFRGIYILEKNDETYYTFKDYRRFALGNIILGCIILFTFGIFFFIELNTPRWIAEGKLN